MKSREERIDSFMEETILKEKAIETDPFLVTRMVQKLENHLDTSKPVHISPLNRVLRPILISAGILLAAGTGILLGWHQGQKSVDSEYISRMDDLQTSLFIRDFTDERILIINEE